MNSTTIVVDKMVDQKTLKTFDKLYYESYNVVLKYVICNCSNSELSLFICKKFIEIYEGTREVINNNGLTIKFTLQMYIDKLL